MLVLKVGSGLGELAQIVKGWPRLPTLGGGDGPNKVIKRFQVDYQRRLQEKEKEKRKIVSYVARQKDQVHL